LIRSVSGWQVASDDGSVRKREGIVLKILIITYRTYSKYLSKQLLNIKFLCAVLTITNEVLTPVRIRNIRNLILVNNSDKVFLDNDIIVVVVGYNYIFIVVFVVVFSQIYNFYI